MKLKKENILTYHAMPLEMCVSDDKSNFYACFVYDDDFDIPCIEYICKKDNNCMNYTIHEFKVKNIFKENKDIYKIYYYGKDMKIKKIELSDEEFKRLVS